MVTIDPSEEAPEGLTGKEFVEWMKEHKKPVPTETAASEEEVEAIAKPKIRGKRVGQMRATKGGKPAGEATEYGGHVGVDASKETFMGRHPKLAKAVDVGKKVVGKVDEFIDEEMIHHGAAERKKPTEEEEVEKKKKRQKKLSSMEKKLQKGFLGEDDDDEDDEDDDKKSKKSKPSGKQNILSRDYETAYGGQGGLFGKRGYESAYKSTLGAGSYHAAYKQPMGQSEQPRAVAMPEMGGRKVKSAVEEIPTTPQPQQKQPEPNRFDIQNWQSMGFPNTLPMSARGNLFRPAPPRPTPQPVVTPMVRQPYQPRPTPQSVIRAPARAPLSGPLPRIGLSMNMPQLMKPRTINPMRAPTSPTHTTAPKTSQMSFMGVTLGEKKKVEVNKPLTKIGEGYKNVPLVVMNGLYPNTGYNPKTDLMTKKSIIPKIKANITPNDFTMFGMRMKKKNI